MMQPRNWLTNGISEITKVHRAAARHLFSLCRCNFMLIVDKRQILAYNREIRVYFKICPWGMCINGILFNEITQHVSLLLFHGIM